MSLYSLTSLNKNESGIIRKIDESQMSKKTGAEVGDLEARLLEMGFIEGVMLTVLHFGIWGRDPIALRINNSNSIIALRKNEASTIFLEKINAR